MDITTRLATLSDLDDLTRIENRAFDEEKYFLNSRRNYRHYLTRGNVKVIVALADDQVVGSAVLFFRSTSQFGRFYSLAVDPDFQGGAVGKILFQAAEDYCRSRTMKGMILEIREDNDRLCNRYIESGYKRSGEVRDYYPDRARCFKFRKYF